MKKDFLFDKHYPSRLYKVQRPSTSLEYNTLIGLVGLLTTNKSVEDTIRGGNPETDAKRNDVGLILLALFIL